ncbi:11975_t:CDS:2 [Racocetra fulgida]|uniref:11975_t:CDS:1 n=1 Tax=Racocetra fulgida TaxID=60492 RepID=A0A9N8Z655_9GLOM|nr:11975_t:CDS:2 [Racocetra fulgida]
MINNVVVVIIRQFPNLKIFDSISTKKRAYVTKKLDYENLDDHIWSDKDIDERASDYFAVLLIAGKNKDVWEPSGRPSTYVRGSKRTLRQKKAELKKAAQNTQSITAYFALP